MFELFLTGVIAFLIILAIFFYFFFWIEHRYRPLSLHRVRENPIISPLPAVWWESEAVFNPAAIVHDGGVHLFFHALGHDGILGIGPASSPDGIHFDERSPVAVYDRGAGFTP